MQSYKQARTQGERAQKFVKDKMSQYKAVKNLSSIANNSIDLVQGKLMGSILKERYLIAR